MSKVKKLSKEELELRNALNAQGYELAFDEENGTWEASDGEFTKFGPYNSLAEMAKGLLTDAQIIIGDKSFDLNDQSEENQTAMTEALRPIVEETLSSNGHKLNSPIQIEDGDKVRYVEPDIKYRFLPVQLTKAEMDIKHNELIEAMDALDQVGREFEEIKKEFKTKIQARENRIEETRNVIKSGFERRDVECVQRFNYDKLTVEDLRSDTKEVVATRAMTQKERQHSLFKETEETATVGN